MRNGHFEETHTAVVQTVNSSRAFTVKDKAGAKSRPCNISVSGGTKMVLGEVKSCFQLTPTSLQDQTVGTAGKAL